MIPYAKELEQIIQNIKKDQTKKRILLHSCCAPCSSYVLEYLRDEFDITVFYYNPNISEHEEYRFRMEEQLRLIRRMNEEGEKTGHGFIRVINGEYNPRLYFEAVKGVEQCREGGERCFRCFCLRLQETAKEAKKGSFDYFTTTLTISPMKNAETLNEIGRRYAEEYQVQWLPSDFKKKNGYKRSVELSGQYQLYRQDYCGCIYSKREREESVLCNKKENDMMEST